MVCQRDLLAGLGVKTMDRVVLCPREDITSQRIKPATDERATVLPLRRDMGLFGIGGHADWSLLLLVYLDQQFVNRRGSGIGHGHFATADMETIRRIQADRLQIGMEQMAVVDFLV